MMNSRKLLFSSFLIGLLVLGLSAQLKPVNATLNHAIRVYVDPNATLNGTAFMGRVLSVGGSFMRSTSLVTPSVMGFGGSQLIDWSHDYEPNIGYRVQVIMGGSDQLYPSWISYAGITDPKVGEIVTTVHPVQMYQCDDSVFINNPPFTPRCWSLFEMSGRVPYEPVWQLVGSCGIGATCDFKELIMDTANLAVMKTGWDE